MAKKGGSKDGCTNDSSVSMPVEHKVPIESNKQKINKVQEVFPSASREQIGKVLQACNDDEQKAIDAFTKDGGLDALKIWTEQCNLKNKNNKNKKKKKKGKKESGTGDLSAAVSFDADDSSSLHSGGNADGELEKETTKVENENGDFEDLVTEIQDLELRLSDPEKTACVSPLKTGPENDKNSPPKSNVEPLANSSEYGSCEASLEQEPKPIQEDFRKDRPKPKREDYQKNVPRQRNGNYYRSKTSSFSEESASQAIPAHAAPTKKGYEKCKKDLCRQTVFLQRIESELEKNLEDSEKLLDNSFLEVQKMLEKHKEEIKQEMQKTKGEALNLVRSRQDLGHDLKKRLECTNTLMEQEWTDLRTDIKQYVTERKYDLEMSKTIWYRWNKDAMTECIKDTFEVHAVKNVYSQPPSGHAEPSPSNDLPTQLKEPAKRSPPAPGKEFSPFQGKSRIFFGKSNPMYEGRPMNSRGRGYYQRGRGGYPRPNFQYNNNYNRNLNRRNRTFRGSSSSYQPEKEDMVNGCADN